ncbi:MAG TPA: hypothetical protein VMG81_01145 [Thermoplasmata archaeon]|nr:hypothetical protein [Thermoplasmata archaeon]
MAGSYPEAPERPPEDPDEWFELQGQLDRVAEEKRKALADPGPSWHDWWYFSASKWYLGLLLFILDIWIVAAALEAGLLAVGLLGLVAALYAEFLFWGFLYYVPASESRWAGRPFRPTWHRLTEYGRWTPEGEAIRRGRRVVVADGAPDPRDFL